MARAWLALLVTMTACGSPETRAPVSMSVEPAHTTWTWPPPPEDDARVRLLVRDGGGP